jgi:hypothetical protein
MRLMRVDADDACDAVPERSNTPCPLNFAGVSGREYAHGAGEACVLRACDDGLEVGLEHLICEVAVSVDHFT